MEQAAELQDLANALAAKSTVHVLDRRGSGGGGPPAPGHGLGVEVEDAQAVLAATGAERVLGLSSGAVIALQTALRTPGITHVIAYEPPITVARRKAAVVARFEKELKAGQNVEALITLVKGLEFGPRALRFVPTRFLAAVLRKGEDEERDLLDRLPTVLQDIRIAEEGAKDLRRFQALEARVLLVGGTRSPDYLTEGLHALADLLPHAGKVLVADADHFTPSEHPDQVLPAFQGFLG
ncbi:alpha/beta hydrolase [Lentzea sp. BCCO 10_0798]|uniref:Alpha/beta hydrolase n=2 Tax=Lentzea kristufekii TaxID=3095430 RepID=A0ABU4TIK1_9PSEU|nr:alpha/beta hydrolase [Lentzea sp. BCCO 10_0798]MDX8048079.1 alpha/beta hydrolase [Lentzea sp. BCCO 10_0798]